MVITFFLEGPLQSWGDSSIANIRDTGDFPTKSGIVGLIANAMGLSRDDPAILYINDHIDIAVREDKKGRWMTDFCAVESPVRERILLQADGKPSNSNIVIYKHYLQDAIFLVAIDCDDEDLAHDIVRFLRKPRRILYLGRKACPTGRPIIPEQSKYSLEEAMIKTPLHSRCDKTKKFFYEVTSDHGEARNDNLIDFGYYGRRYVERRCFSVSDKDKS